MPLAGAEWLVGPAPVPASVTPDSTMTRMQAPESPPGETGYRAGDHFLRLLGAIPDISCGINGSNGPSEVQHSTLSKWSQSLAWKGLQRSHNPGPYRIITPLSKKK